jgi:hypothetical protein
MLITPSTVPGSTVRFVFNEYMGGITNSQSPTVAHSRPRDRLESRF